jgi:hypothetical protein
MTKIRFTTVSGHVQEIDAKIPKSLDPRFDFLKTDEEMETIENSRHKYVEAFLHHVLPSSVFAIVGSAKIVADPDANSYELDLVEQTRPIDLEV